MPNHPFEPLKKWFLENRRDLPWRESPTPYAVWVSEVMLQQTQVSVVIPYFLRWMDLFPSIEDLANAEIQEVIKAWEGLGYYSRARNLHSGAKYVRDHHRGTLPSDTESLAKIKGLGPYTIGAIQSFAFHQKTPAVDGNVLRVAARYCMLKEDIKRSKTAAAIRKWVEKALPDETPWIINEALIELGAAICNRKPNCSKCPLNQTCLSFQHGVQEQLPIKGKPPTSIPLYRTVAVIESNGYYLVKKGEEGMIMQDLHEFPYFENESQKQDIEHLIGQIDRHLGIKAALCRELPLIKHTFTKYRVSLFPFLLATGERKSVTGFEWLDKESLMNLAFSSGHRKIFDYIRSA